MPDTPHTVIKHLSMGNSVASGGGCEPPEYFEQNQNIKKPRAFYKTKGLFCSYNSMNYKAMWRPQGGSNPCYRRERAVS